MKHTARSLLWLAVIALVVTGIVLLAVTGWAVFFRTPPDRTVGLILKTEKNPFFVTMKEKAIDVARTRQLKLLTAAGQYDGDTQTQVEAIESMVQAGAKTLLITPNGPAVNNAIRQARSNGVMVLALDGGTEPPDVVDGLLATDNYQAGYLIGQYAKTALHGQVPRIAMIGLEMQSVGVQRHNGFLAGFGLPGISSTLLSPARPAEVVCVGNSFGERARGQAAMAQCLRQAPGINLIYTVNEPTAAGVHEALSAAGKAGSAVILSVDGGCQGVRDVGSGIIAATAQQYPAMMVTYGLEAADTFARTGRKLTGYFDTGVDLITDHRQAGDKSLPVARGLANCWG